MELYFRTNLSKNSGLGHIVRTKRICKKLKKFNISPKIYIDCNLTQYQKDKELINLYNKAIRFDQNQDASLFLSKTKKRGIVVVDDYRVNSLWLKKISQFHKKIIIFDDYSKKYNFVNTIKPDFLLDKEKLYYENLNKGKKLLLGPDYAVLDSFKKKKNSSTKFKIIFYTGGSGDILPLVNIITELKKNNKIFDKFLIYIVVGIFAKNRESIKKINQFKNIKIIDSKKDVLTKLNFADLFVGASGLSMYELKLYNIPRILFEMNDNQKCKTNAHDKLGNFFVLKKNDLMKSKKISKLINLICKKYKLMAAFKSKDLYQVDDGGAERIAKYILNKKTISKKNIYTNKYVPKKKEYYLKKTDLTQINSSLIFRNHKINMANSINKRKIKSIDHYIWWLSSNRISYGFYKNSKLLINLFHDVVKIDNKKWIIPGWYTNPENKGGFLDILKGIHFHYFKKIRFIEKKLKIHSLSLIKKENQSMLLFAKKIKWKQVHENNKKILTICKKYFKNASTNFFNFYIR